MNLIVELSGYFLGSWVIGYGCGLLVYTFRKISENVV